MAFLHPDLRWHISNMKWLRVCQSCIIPFASQCHGGLSERTGDERISFGAILSTGSFGRLDVSKPQICALMDLGSITLPVCSKRTSGDFLILCINSRFFFSASGDGRNPSGSQCFSGPLPKWRSNCSHFGFTGLMGWLIWWALWVGGLGVTGGSHLRASFVFWWF